MSGPPVRRIVTGHNAEGRAVFRSDEQFEPKVIPSGDAAMALVWTTATVPADNNDETDGRERDAGERLRSFGARSTADPCAAMYNCTTSSPTTLPVLETSIVATSVSVRPKCSG